MKLSFIVPIYGVEPYLRKCIDSLLHQDFQDYEIILVDDGGKDGCPAICDEYAAMYDNIKVIHRENGGLSAARNSGIDAAIGEYICFVDSDDYWMENVLGGLIQQIERDNLEVLRFNFRNVNEDGEEELPRQTTDPHIYQDYSIEVTNGLGFIAKRLGIGTYAWQFILKHSLSQKERFTEGLLFEDLDWSPRMLMHVERIASNQKVVYNYLTRIGSITKAINIDNKRKVLDDKIKLTRFLNCMKSRADIHDSNAFLWFDGMISATVLGVIEILAKDFYDERNLYLNRLKHLDIFPLSTYHIWPKAQKKIQLINISPRLALFILHIR